MNCRQAEQWLLLKDTGELPARKLLRLEEHLADCASCRACQDDLDRVIKAARRSLPAGVPAAQTLAAIREAARAGVPLRQAAVLSWSWTVWQPVLAAAAILLLCLGGWFWLADRGPSAGGPSVAWEQPAVKPVLPAGANGDDFPALLVEDVVPIERISDLALQADLSPLDRDILFLEGLAI